MLITIGASSLDLSRHPQIPETEFARLVPIAVTEITNQHDSAHLGMMIHGLPSQFKVLITNIIIGLYSVELYGNSQDKTYYKGDDGILYIVDDENMPKNLRAKKFKVINKQK
jgi:hypothetical protein